MTAEEKLTEVFDASYFAEYPGNDTFEATIQAMKEYAELKCKELLEIVAEKANLIEHEDYNYPNEYYVEIDKDSILNTVDLKEFIK